jgi:hypothetical protein
LRFLLALPLEAPVACLAFWMAAWVTCEPFMLGVGGKGDEALGRMYVCLVGMCLLFLSRRAVLDRVCTAQSSAGLALRARGDLYDAGSSGDRNSGWLAGRGGGRRGRER